MPAADALALEGRDPAPEHLADAILIGKADAALAASIFHFGEYTVRQTKQIMAARGVPADAQRTGIPHAATRPSS